MLTRQILQQCLSQQLRRNWTSYKKKTKWILLHCETTNPSHIYIYIEFIHIYIHIYWIHAKCRPYDKFTGIETNDDYNETIKFEWDLYLSVLS